MKKCINYSNNADQVNTTNIQRIILDNMRTVELNHKEKIV